MLGGAKCPVDERERVWIERSMAWLAGQFGPEPLLRRPLLPTADDFPGPFRGTDAEIRALVERLCGHVGVDPAGIVVEIEPDDGEAGIAAELGLTYHSRSAAGHYRLQNGRPVVAIDQGGADDPVALVATIGHELGHVRLLGERRADPDSPDHEPLTDLFTVHFGLGVFNANSAFNHRVGNGRSRTTRLGYLTEPMYGYALACYAHLRAEPKPQWARFLDTNPRGYLRQGLRYLARNPLPPLPAGAREQQ